MQEQGQDEQRGAGEPVATAFWATGPGQGELRSEPLTAAAPGEPEHGTAPVGPTSHSPDMVLVRTLYSGLSRGTESLVRQGRIPLSERDRMRAPFQKGSFPFPVKYGYMAVGQVEAGPGHLLGSRVFCLHPHQDRFRAPAAAVVKVPEGVPSRRAVLGANMETAVNVAWDAEPSVGDRIAIVGAGVVGLMCAYLLAQIPGTEVSLVDVNASRAELAQAFGARFEPGPLGVQPGHRGTYDLVVHASGTSAGLVDALALAGPEARVVEASWYGDRAVEVPLGHAFHSQRLHLRSSQVGQIPPQKMRRWDHRRRLSLALELLRDPALDGLISSEDLFETMPERIGQRLDDPATLCAVFAYTPQSPCTP